MNEKVTLDFLANTGFVTIIFAVEKLFTVAFIDHNFWFLIGCILSVIICYILFYSTVAVAKETVKVLNILSHKPVHTLKTLNLVFYVIDAFVEVFSGKIAFLIKYQPIHRGIYPYTAIFSLFSFL